MRACTFWEPEIVLKVKQNNFRFATRTKHGNQQAISGHILAKQNIDSSHKY